MLLLPAKFSSRFGKLFLLIFVGFLGTEAFLFSGCGKLQSIPNIRSLELIGAGNTKAFSWTAPTIIDAGNYDVNNDTSVSCGNAISGGRGCAQTPSIVYSDNRWHLGFAQNYLATAVVKYSILVNMTSLGSGFFSAYGFGLGVIDSGLGITTAPATAASSRYIQMAALDSGDVVAVYFVEDNTNLRRQVFASVYDAGQKVWTAAIQLSTSTVTVITDGGTDFSIPGGSMITAFCRPQVATSGGTAIATWCEGITGGSGSHIVHSIYSNGSWSVSGGSTPPDVASYTADGFPGVHATTQSYSGAFTVGDVVSASITLTTDATATPVLVDVATVTAVSQTPVSGQFQLITNPTTGAVLMCPSMKNMIDALMHKKTVQYNSGSCGSCTESTYTLSTRNASMKLDPSCTETSGRNITMYYNQGLNPVFRTLSGSPTNLVNGISTTSATFIPAAASVFSIQELARKSAWVAIAGDGYGNFGLVRSIVSPFFLSNSVATTSMLQARLLVGHEYVLGSGWIQRSGATASTQPNTTVVSQSPVCSSGATSGEIYSACSIRNPRFIMSSTGNGLVLFYQNQVNKPNTLDSTVPNPSRLWFAPYSTATGFTKAALPLDADTFCNSFAVVNDKPVCEAQAYGLPCQAVDEPQPATPAARLKYPNTATNLSHDITPISAAMNGRGQAIIAYHKYYSNGVSCANVGTFVAMYDPTNGLSTPVQVDDGLANTMHAHVAINNKGDAAAVWEEIDTSAAAHYVFFRLYKNGQWSGEKLINDDGGILIDTNSMMPAVGINDNGEIVVTFTRSLNGVRRQYARQYFNH